MPVADQPQSAPGDKGVQDEGVARLVGLREAGAGEAELLRVESELLSATDNGPRDTDPPPVAGEEISSDELPQLAIARGPSAAAVLAEAARWSGYAEQPAGSNHTMFGRWYGMDPAPWCAMFVSYCFAQMGLPLPATTPKGFAYCPSGATWFKGQGRWRGQNAPIEPGCLVFYSFSGVGRISHVGIVASVSGSTFTAWEGNTDSRGGGTGGRVMLQRRSRATVGAGGGFGVPSFIGPPTPPSPQPPPDPYPAWPGRVLTVVDPLMQGEDVRTWQARMAERGWRITADGIYGPKSAEACRTFQGEKGLVVDGEVGRETWGAAWTAPL